MVKPKPTKAQGDQSRHRWRDASFRQPKREPQPTSTESFWQKYATGPREDGQLEAEAQVRALKSPAPILLQDWTSTV